MNRKSLRTRHKNFGQVDTADRGLKEVDAYIYIYKHKNVFRRNLYTIVCITSDLKSVSVFPFYIVKYILTILNQERKWPRNLT